jgi:hypothetical protein
MKIYTFCDITARSPVEFNRSLGGTGCLHFQFQGVKQARKQREADK